MWRLWKFKNDKNNTIIITRDKEIHRPLSYVDRYIQSSMAAHFAFWRSKCFLITRRRLKENQQHGTQQPRRSTQTPTLTTATSRPSWPSTGTLITSTLSFRLPVIPCCHAFNFMLLTQYLSFLILMLSLSQKTSVTKKLILCLQMQVKSWFM